ncbi:MAG: efflux RND transporter periplasmic adaptor subunit [Acidobacteriota bacterium]
MIQEASSMDRVVAGRKGLGRKSWILLAAAVVLIIGAIMLYPSFSRWAAADRSVEAARLRIGSVTRGNLLRDVSVQGQIVAADQPTLVSPAQGVVSIVARAGDVVTRGSVVARLESPDVQNRLKQERSTLLSLKSDLERQKITTKQNDQQNLQQVALLTLRLETGERAMKRAKSLVDEGLGNAVDYERAQDDVRVVTLELAHAREKARLDKETADFEIRSRELLIERQVLNIGEAERKVAELVVVSPVSGLVSRVDAKDKDTVQPNQPLLTVVDLSRYQVEVSIPENYAVEIPLGTPVAVQHDGKEYQGVVKSLSPEVLASIVKGIVVFVGEAPAGLKQNQRVNTRLILDSRNGVLKAPRGPFVESLGGRQVYVVEDGMAVLRPVTLGAISVTEVEILTGLVEGEQIILSDMSRFEGARTILLRQ